MKPRKDELERYCLKFKKSQVYWIAIVIFLEARGPVKTLAGVASKRLKETAFCFLYLRPLYYLPENKDIPGSPKASQKIM